jgi:RHS repeat-associated protein
MGCLKLYNQEAEGLEESTVFLWGRLKGKEGALKNRYNYYPFGLTFNSYQRSYSKANNYLYQGKELQPEIDIYDSEWRGYDHILGRTWQQDPHAENYFSLSPYSWAANNPLMYTDPDGRDIIIYYQDEDGENQRFVFNGSNSSDAPKNEFVQQFFEAYNTLQENGVGENVKAIAENSKTQVNLYKADRNTSEGYSIWWNPVGGSKTDEGVVLSPATVLEHESDHRNHYDLYPDEHRKLQGQKLPGWKNAEEKRVITGSELNTARAMGEVSPTGITRNNHSGDQVITSGPTSNKVGGKATYNFYMQKAKNTTNVYYKEAYQRLAKKYYNEK